MSHTEFMVFLHQKGSPRFGLSSLIGMGEAGVAHIFALIILVIGLIVGVYLVTHPAIFRPKAYSTSNVTFTNASGIALPRSITEPVVHLLLKLPDGWYVPSKEDPTSSLPFIKNAYAQEESCPQSGKGVTNTCGETTYNICVDNGKGDSRDGTLCQTGGTTFRCFYSGNQKYCLSGKDEYDYNYSCTACNNSGPVSSPIASPSTCFIGKSCSCSRDLAGSCGECSGGWCNDRQCSSCSAETPIPLLPPPSPDEASGSGTMPAVTVDVNTSCSGPHGIYNDNHLDLNVNVQSRDLLTPGDYILLGITDEKTKEIGYNSLTSSSRIFEFHGSYKSEAFPGVFPLHDNVDLVSDGRNYTVSAYIVSNKDMLSPVSGKLVATTSFYQFCDFPPLRPKQERKLREIIIENADTDESGGGFSKRILTSNLEDYINKPIEWRLNSLKENDSNVSRTVKVTFLSEDSASEIYYADINLKYQLLHENDEIPVDLVIDKKFSNIQDVEDWGKDTINNYINDKLQTGGIKRKVRFNTSFVDFVQTCTEFWTPQPVSDQKIVVYISSKYTGKAWAMAKDHSICFGSFSKNNNVISKSVLTHEMGHIFGLPDYYLEQIYDNQVIPSTNLDAFDKDIMYNQDQYYDFGSNSKTIINNLSNPLPEDYRYWVYYSPKQVFLQVLDDNKLPIPKARVDIFPAIYDWKEGSEYVHRFVPNNPSISRDTDNTGRIFLGDQADIFNHKKYPYAGSTGAALVRIIVNGEARYGAISMSYLNNLFFSQNPNGIATIVTKFPDMYKVESILDYASIRPFSNTVITKRIQPKGRVDEQESHLYTELKVSGDLEKHKAP